MKHSLSVLSCSLFTFAGAAEDQRYEAGQCSVETVERLESFTGMTARFMNNHQRLDPRPNFIDNVKNPVVQNYP